MGDAHVTCHDGDTAPLGVAIASALTATTRLTSGRTSALVFMRMDERQLAMRRSIAPIASHSLDFDQRQGLESSSRPSNFRTLNCLSVPEVDLGN
jgi:hypothetical protein